MLFTRESLRRFLMSLGRPLGVPAPSVSAALARDSAPAPRLPRVFAALFLIGSIVMLGLPEVRASLASVLFRETSVEWDIQRLREKARINHDPQLLAFLSLVLSYDNEHFELADEAIQRDSSLTWIDYVESYWNYLDPDRRHFLSDGRIARLQKFDPRNAVPLLLSAEVLSHPVQLSYFANSHDSALAEDRVWEHDVAKNPLWLSAMDRVFAAPEFHYYMGQQIALVRQVSERYQLSNPDLILDALVRARRLADYSDIDAYSLFLMERGVKATQDGNPAAAMAEYEKIEHIAEVIAGGDKFESDRWFAAKMGRKYAQRLQSLFESTGYGAEAQIAARKFAKWNDSSARLQMLWSRDRYLDTSGIPRSVRERAGLLINLAVVLIAVFFPLTIVILLSIGFAPILSHRILGRLYRGVCLAADAAPILLVASFSLVFVAYHPYAHPYQSASNLEGIVVAAGVTHTLPITVRYFLFNLTLHGAYYFWAAMTVGLSALALFLLYRMMLKQDKRQA